MGLLVVAAAAALLSAVPLFAQRHDDAITVSVVEVPVVVERSGKLVTGLTRNDFELLVNGQPQPIEYFDVLDERSSTPADPAAPAPAVELRRRRMTVLLFDVSGSSPRSLYRARRDASRLVAESPGGQTFAVAIIARSGVRFLVPFTNDRVAVQRAIGTFAPSGAADPFGVATLQAERSFWSEVVGGSDAASAGWDAIPSGAGGGLEGSRSAAAAASFYRMLADAENEEKLIRDDRFVRDLADLAERMASLDGVKHVVLLSERTSVEGATVRLSNTMKSLHRRFAGSGVILDAVDIRGQRAPGGNASSRGRASSSDTPEMPQRADLMPSRLLYNLALDTGGAVATSLGDLERRNGYTYIIGFSETRGKRGRNSIRVRLKNAPFLTELRYRRSFSLGDRKGGDDGLFLADTLLNDIPQHGVTVDVAVRGTWIEASIPGAELLAHPASLPLPLDVFFYVFDARREPVAWSETSVRVDLATGRTFLESHPYSIRQQFQLEPGRYAAKVVVRVRGKDLPGFGRTEFEVAAP